jgi:FkbM family methyltransferase
VANFVSYAQNSEDVMLWRAFQSVQEGFYIDLGAGDPERDSVTAAFYSRGWRGLNVEPNPEIFRKLVASREGDINLHLAAGADEGETELFIVDDDDRLSTTKQDIAGLHGQAGHGTHSTRIRIRPLRDVCAEYVTGPIHFLKIDVEGAEAEAIRGADFSRWRPWVILVEAIDPVSLQPSHAEWEGMLLEAGYHFVYFDGLNRFYVANERAEQLDTHFATPPNVRDAFIRSAEALALNLRRIEADHVAVVHELNTTAYRLRAERDACIASRDDMAAALRTAQDEAARQGSQMEAAGAAARVDIERLTAERNGWMQELFETNRHAAYLAQERQSLLERLAPLQPYAENVERAFKAARLEIERLESENDRLAAGQAPLQTYADNVQRALERTQAEVAAARAETDAAQAATDAARAEMAAARAEAEQLRTRADASQRHIDDIRHSTSWRLTLPLRVLRRLAPGQRRG